MSSTHMTSPCILVILGETKQDVTWDKIGHFPSKGIADPPFTPHRPLKNVQNSET